MPALAVEANAIGATTAAAATTSVRRMSPFMCEVPSIGLPASPSRPLGAPTTYNRRRFDPFLPHVLTFSSRYRCRHGAAHRADAPAAGPQAGAPRERRHGRLQRGPSCWLPLAHRRGGRARPRSVTRARAGVRRRAGAGRRVSSSAWGPATAVPTQLVFVPMLLLLPTPYVPLLVAAAFALRSACGGAAAGRRAGPGAESLRRRVVLRSLPAVVDHRARCPGGGLGALSRSTRWPSARSWLVDDLESTSRAWGSPCACRRARPRADLELSPSGSTSCSRRSASSPRWLPSTRLAGALLVPPPCSRSWSASSASGRARIERSLELGRAIRGTAPLLRDLLEEDDEYTGHHTEDVVALSVAGRRAA